MSRQTRVPEVMWGSVAGASQLPLVLWICAALVGHYAGGNVAVEVATIVEGREALRRMVEETREGVRDLNGQDDTLEVALLEIEPTPPEAALNIADDAEEDGDAEIDEPPDDPQLPKPEKKKKEEDAKVEPPAPEPPAPTPKPEDKKDEPKPEVSLPIVPQKSLPPPDQRIAIKQHTDPNQADNPDAARLADNANKTDQETVAQIRAYDGDAAKPDPGAHAGPRGAVGDSSESELGHVRELDGDPERAPGENAPNGASLTPSAPTPPSPPQVARTNVPVGVGGPPGAKAAPTPNTPTSRAEPPSPGGAGPSAPEAIAQGAGAWKLDPANPGGDGKSPKPSRRRPEPKKRLSPVDVRALGLGGTGLPGVANLSDTGFQAAVGEEQLKRERLADGASRRKRHRGSSHTTNFDRWKAAVENYEPRVKLGNQTNLNAAASPFASYLNSIHNRLHPVFADTYLASLSGLSMSDPLNQLELVTHLEVVISARDGRLVDLGVTKQSGVMAFDVTALKAVEQASPFGAAPDAIVSPDGNVYLHWEFHRDPFDACSTRNAKPFLLKEAPEPRKKRVPVAPPRKGSQKDERPGSGPLLPIKP